MLYHLLFSLHTEVSWLNVFRYITFRSAVAFLFSFLFVLAIEPKFIAKLRKRGVKGQPIRDDGPKTHEVKQGTPTMGGIVIIGAVVSSTLLFADLSNRYIWLALFTLIGFAALGFIDDWRKITQQNTKGVSGKAKLFWQSLIAATVAVVLMSLDFPTDLKIPFFKDFGIELSYFFVPFVMIVIVGTSNAVNLTDGLDGLAIGSVMTVAGSYAIFTYLIGHATLAEYLAIPSIPGAGEVTVVLASIVAAGLGFLWFNTFPAQVFMGDIGALSLGGILGFSAVLVKQELLLIVAGGIFVVEALSVIIQRYTYKLTKKRVFRMAPIHHHFELLGWPEPKIIVRFWIVSIVLALISLTTLKLR
ncbi:MAG: phospho-N-acetylmuramoyl-pentapeptide-transferase [Bdellovibrionales bacterium]|nr:phospho-N-acetylmuramoyl-pentapeptide-transferase [Bdellovibrionales bacterium]